MTSSLSLSVEHIDVIVRREGADVSRSAEHVIVRIDGVDVSRADNNAGPDPWYVLVPVNRFVATSEFTTAVIACCPGCGPDCDAVEARIRREGGTVRWEWGRRGPRWDDERRTTLFDAGDYDAEVARLGADRGWETAEHRAGRLILAGLALPARIEGIKVRTVGDGELEVWLEERDAYQIFVRAAWDRERPDESAAAVRAVIAGPPARWPAQWHGVTSDRQETPPVYAGPSWQRADWS